MTAHRQFNRHKPRQTVVKLAVMLLILAGSLANGLRAGQISPLQLNAVAQVDSSGVFLQQLVTADSPLPALRLCDAPVFGKTIELTRAQINGLLTAAAPGRATTNWTGADTVEISRRVHTLTEADVVALLTATLQKKYVMDKGELELNLTQPWSAPTLPDEPLTVNILELPTVGVTPAFIIRFQLCTATETVGTWQTSVRAHIWSEVWVAHSNLQRGELISDADVARERRDVLGVSESLAEFSPQDSSIQLANQVQAGGILLARNLKPRTVVHRGQMADAILEDGALSIMMKVEVLEDGAPGQMVRARNPVSQRYLSGKVIDEKTISVSL